MQPTLSLVPGASHASSASIADTANSQGVHDTLRHGVRSLAADVAPAHPLQARLENWDDHREMLQLTLQRQMFGLHMPVRQMMERSLVKQVSHTPPKSTLPMTYGIHPVSYTAQSVVPRSLGGFTRPSNLHLDILLGNDEQIDVADVLRGEEVISLAPYDRLTDNTTASRYTDRVETADVGDFHRAMEQKMLKS
ncbi:BQ5605_C005g03592 [Microbotryum silenes-dioicae]|uniref:BQ5605_C005g03592 protein n=1 Tax=Microbotryum silenes-dioicae TaxID=796604 RepID=A0A2X0MBD1_9BASI|nr:BQ5605_C005g03592 [Microbotryum silenes-dioicae]